MNYIFVNRRAGRAQVGRNFHSRRYWTLPPEGHAMGGNLLEYTFNWGFFGLAGEEGNLI